MGKKLKVKKLQGSSYVIAEEQLGKGSFATIYQCYNLENLHQQLACKIICLEHAQKSQTIKSQLEMLKKLPTHQNLVNHHRKQISSENNFYIIMEYCNQGNLDKYLVRMKNQILEYKIWYFLKEFCQGYKVLYENSIVHRDIKPQNILIHNGVFKIADFGLAKILKNTKILENMSIKGTPLYMAPEIQHSRQGNSKIDVFSLGVLLYRMSFKGQYPFFDQDRHYPSISQYFKEVMLRKLRIPVDHHRSTELVQLIKRMLQKKNQDRISWELIFDHPRIKNAVKHDKRKQLLPMNQFKNSFIIANRSVTEVKLLEQPEIKNYNELKACIILQENFNKQGKTSFQLKLYHHKLIYTCIDYTNKKIQTYLIQNQELHKHMKKTLKNLQIEGILYSLNILQKLKEISGDWDNMQLFKVNILENIFESDKNVILQKLTEITNKFQNSLIQYHQGIYQDVLYNYLTEFIEYPIPLRSSLRIITVLLIDIYDMILKHIDTNPHHNEISKIEIIEDQSTNQFYNYLLSTQTVTEEQLKNELRTKGLLI